MRNVSFSRRASFSREMLHVSFCQLCLRNALSLTFNNVSDKSNSEPPAWRDLYCNHSRMEWLEKGKEMRYPFKEEGLSLKYVTSSRNVFVLATILSNFTNDSYEKDSLSIIYTIYEIFIYKIYEILWIFFHFSAYVTLVKSTSLSLSLCIQLKSIPT